MMTSSHVIQSSGMLPPSFVRTRRRIAARDAGPVCLAASMRKPLNPMDIRSTRYDAMRSCTYGFSELRSASPTSQPLVMICPSVQELRLRSQWKSVGP